jgi:beta-N-acetylhexosaminidase
VRRTIALAIAALVLVVPEEVLGAPLEEGTPAAGPVVAVLGSPGGRDLRPDIVWRRIPFGARRKRQMAAYSRRHYGRRAFVLRHPQVVVEHYTSGTSFDSAWNHFAANGVHLGERPGVCAHFLIDTDGTIHQLVNLRLRCRHAIGMNWTAIGIEHVGTNAGQVLGNARMMRASLRLTVWLMARFEISWGNVIGHAETLQSPFHVERYRSWRCRTHADLNHAEMRRYRRRVRPLARRLDVPIGDRPAWVDSGC